MKKKTYNVYHGYVKARKVFVYCKDGSIISGFHDGLGNFDDDGNAFYYIGDEVSGGEYGRLSFNNLQKIPVKDIEKIVRQS